MLAEMCVPFAPDCGAADIAHCISAGTYELVAAVAFDEARIALGTCPFDCCGGRSFNRLSQRGSRAFMTDVRIFPGKVAKCAASTTAGWIETGEAESAAVEMDAVI